MSPRIRLIVVAVLLCGALAVIFAPEYRAAVSEREMAREEYRTAHRELRLATHQRDDIEQKAIALRTQLDSIRLGARREYRLILPGERLLVVREQPAAGE